MTTGREILEYLRERVEEMVGLVEEMALVESPTTVAGAQAGVFAILERELEGLGFRTRRLGGRGSGGQLLAMPGRRGKGPFQVVLGHGDTVWPLGTLEGMPVARREGRLYGPGTFDMKGGLAQAVFALKALEALGALPQVTPVVFVSSDEETGGKDSLGRIVRLARRADRVLVVEPALGPAGLLKTARRGGGTLTVEVEGRSAHSGLDPEKGASAIVALAHAILRLSEMTDRERGIDVNVGVVEGGSRANVVADRARAEVDVRVLYGEDAGRLEREIRGLTAKVPGTRIRVTGDVDRPPMEKTPGNRELWRRARTAAQELGLEIGEGTSGGGSDGNFTSAHTPTLDGLGPVGAGAHAPEEHVEIARLPERAALLARLLLEPPVRTGTAARP